MPPSLFPERVGSHWVFLDGTILPVVRGGDGDLPEPEGDPPDPDLGEAGKKALASERARAREADKRAKAAERKAEEAEERAARLAEASKSDQEKALEQATKTARQEATAEATAKANRRILTAEVKAAAGGKLTDPADAVRLLDLDEFSVSDDGEVDDKALSAAIAELLKDKPYLALDAKKVTGSADGGARPNGDKPLDDSPRSLITSALEANQSARKHR